MVWGGVSLEGRTDLHVTANDTLTAVRYRDEILRTIFRPDAGAVGPVFLLVQVGAHWPLTLSHSLILPLHCPYRSSVYYIWCTCSVHFWGHARPMLQMDAGYASQPSCAHVHVVNSNYISFFTNKPHRILKEHRCHVWREMIGQLAELLYGLISYLQLNLQS